MHRAAGDHPVIFSQEIDRSSFREIGNIACGYNRYSGVFSCHFAQVQAHERISFYAFGENWFLAQRPFGDVVLDKQGIKTVKTENPKYH